MSRLRAVILLSSLLTGGTLTVQAQPRQWNWEKLVLPPPYDRGFYLDIMFLPSNPQYGWACGFGGYVVRTTDGGMTWEGTTIPNADQLESIIFVNERVGYCSGTNNGNPNLGGIYKSTDGGRSWREITPVILLNGTMQRAPVWGCYFLDERVGMVVGGGCGDIPQLFFRTTDGGASWSVFVAYERETGLSHVLMYDAEGLSYASSSGRLWRSFDGGRSWQMFAVTGPAIWQENLAHRGNTFLVATAGNSCTGGTGTIGDIRWSYDGGQTWSRYPTGASMFGTYLVDQNVGWAVGWNRSVYRIARDPARNQVDVTPYRCGLEPGSNYDDVWFVNDTLGYLVGDGIYRTTLRDLLEPIIVSSSGQFVVCDGQPITLSVVKGDRIRQPYTEYLWSTGERTPTITVTKGGNYWVEVRDPDACSGKSLTVTVTEAPSPKVDIRLIAPQRLCEGDTIIVEALLDTSAIGIAEFEWIGRSDREQRLVLIVQRGMLQFQIRARGVNGCEAISRIVAVNVQGRPTPTIALSKPLIARADGALVLCPGVAVELRASDGYATYQWNTGETTQTITVRQGGSYRVTVTAGAPGESCSGTSAPIDIVIGDTVKPTVLSNRGMRLCDGDQIILRTERPYKQYRWSTGEETATIVVATAGDYWVEVTDEYGCSGTSDVVRVEVDPNPIEIVGIASSLLQFDTTRATTVQCDSLRVRNTSSQTLVIGSATMARNIEFSVPLSQLPLVIPPGQERWLIVCFQPSWLGQQRDTLRISDAADYCSRQLNVVGICAANMYQASSSCNIEIRGQTQMFDVQGIVVVPPYPNPAQDLVVVHVRQKDVSAIVRTAGGSACVECIREEVSPQRWELRCRLDHLPSGLYILELVAAQRQWWYPVVVVR